MKYPREYPLFSHLFLCRYHKLLRSWFYNNLRCSLPSVSNKSSVPTNVPVRKRKRKRDHTVISCNIWLCTYHHLQEAIQELDIGWKQFDDLLAHHHDRATHLKVSQNKERGLKLSNTSILLYHIGSWYWPFLMVISKYQSRDILMLMLTHHIKIMAIWSLLI